MSMKSAPGGFGGETDEQKKEGTRAGEYKEDWEVGVASDLFLKCWSSEAATVIVAFAAAR